jgi:hypothetical protein
MHGTPLTRPQWRTGRSRHLRPLTLKDRLPRHGTSRRWPHRRTSLCTGLNRLRRRRLIDRPRSGLRDDHAWRRSHWRSRPHRRCRYRWRWRRGRRNRRSCHLNCRLRRWRRRRWCCWANGRRWRSSRRRGCGYRSCRLSRRNHRRCRWTHDRSRRPRRLRRNESRCWRRRCCWFRCRWWRRRRSRGRRRCSGWLGLNCRRAWCRRARRRRRRSRCGCLLLLRDQLQNIARLGDVRQVNLRLDFFRLSPETRTARRRTRLGGRAEVRPHFFRLVVLERTGVRLLLGDSNFGENIKDGLALDFQFPGQVVDSNLTHLPFLCPAPAP